jgi:predicted homoserine dehydrogenase-like protein
MVPLCQQAQCVNAPHVASAYTCRWCSSPDQRAYTLLAKRDIKAGEALLDYIGRYMLEKDAQFEDKLQEVGIQWLPVSCAH